MIFLSKHRFRFYSLLVISFKLIYMLFFAGSGLAYLFLTVSLPGQWLVPDSCIKGFKKVQAIRRYFLIFWQTKSAKFYRNSPYRQIIPRRYQQPVLRQREWKRKNWQSHRRFVCPFTKAWLKGIDFETENWILRPSFLAIKEWRYWEFDGRLLPTFEWVYFDRTFWIWSTTGLSKNCFRNGR